MVMRLRAVRLVSKVLEDGVAQPGEEDEEHDVIALGQISNRHSVPADDDSVAAARRRLAAAGVSLGPPLGGGVHERPVSGAGRGVHGARLDRPFAGWKDGRGPLEQTVSG
jgi:hypothetical protein